MDNLVYLLLMLLNLNVVFFHKSKIRILFYIYLSLEVSESWDFLLKIGQFITGQANLSFSYAGSNFFFVLSSQFK
jgi:hypothetical protein